MAEQLDQLCLLQDPSFRRLLMEVLQRQMDHRSGECLNALELFHFYLVDVAELVALRALLEAAQARMGVGRV
jgi:hypothetical protein